MQLHFFVLQYHKNYFLTDYMLHYIFLYSSFMARKLQLNKANVTEQKIKLSV